MAVRTTEVWEWVNNDSKESMKVECPHGDEGKALQ